MSKNMIKPQICQICGCGLSKYSIPGMLYCPDCSFVTTDIKLSISQQKRLYGGGYFKGGEYADYSADEILIKKNFEDRLIKLLSFIDNPGSKTLFEIGSAYGFFLDIAKKYFKKVSGIDISGDAATSAKKRGLNVICGDFLKKEIKQQTDVFCMWDTIEHLPDAAGVVAKIGKKIKKDGLLAVTTGDINSLNAKLRGSKWRQIRPPVHLHYFSRKSLVRLFENNGFEVIYLGYPGQYANLGNLFKIMFIIRNKLDFLYDLFSFLGFTKLNIYYNIYDLMYMIGRKT
jgi:SAM-dependent methyltransferase